ncbi:MAG TPA: hypothetical protein VGF67_03470 [Ktedonobacteraceae bacterium]
MEALSLTAGENPLLTPVQTLLIRAVLALPQLPDRTCADESGALYFFQGGQRLTALSAQRFRCRVVTIEGSGQERQVTPDFWLLVDQIVAAAPPAGAPE